MVAKFTRMEYEPNFSAPSMRASTTFVSRPRGIAIADVASSDTAFERKLTTHRPRTRSWNCAFSKGAYQVSTSDRKRIQRDGSSTPSSRPKVFVMKYILGRIEKNPLCFRIAVRGSSVRSGFEAIDRIVMLRFDRAAPISARNARFRRLRS